MSPQSQLQVQQSSIWYHPKEERAAMAAKDIADRMGRYKVDLSERKKESKARQKRKKLET